MTNREQLHFVIKHASKREMLADILAPLVLPAAGVGVGHYLDKTRNEEGNKLRYGLAGLTGPLLGRAFSENNPLPHLLGMGLGGYLPLKFIEAEPQSIQGKIKRTIAGPSLF